MDKERAQLKRQRRKQRQKPKQEQKYFDYSLLAVLVFLICFGMVILFSTSSYTAQMDYGDSWYYFKRQLLFCCLGAGGMFVATRLEYHVYAKFAPAVYIISFILMGLVQTPLGKEVNGARRWLRMPFEQQLQPVEIAKIAIIIFIPYLLCKMGKNAYSLKGVVTVLGFGALSFCGALFLTDNLSSAIIVMGISCVLVFLVHPKTAPFVALIIGGLFLALVGVQILNHMIEGAGSSNFRMRRILVWLDPERYAADGGYQVMQGLYAIGSGGFFGKGLGNSVQKMRIPEVQNDMILSIIGEELGVFGILVVLVLFGFLLYRLMFIAQNAPDLYGSLVVSGIFAHIALQVFFNVAVVINLIPTTGISLPFISYGGTALLFLMGEMGIAFSVSRKIKLE